jgi:steroid delta-isomerase-like uncharacterized protein
LAAEQNKTLSRNVVEEVWNRGNFAAFEQLFSPDFVYRDPDQPHVTTLRDYAQMVTMYRHAFPNLQIVVEGQIAEGQMVVTWWGERGTHTGPLLNISPTNKTITITGITIDRFERGKIAESRTIWDALGFFQQLGVVPTINLTVPPETSFTPGIGVGSGLSGPR